MSNPVIWISPRVALTMLGAQKLAQLTNEAGQQELLGVGDTSNSVFTTPFAFGADLKVYVDAVLSNPADYVLTVDYLHGERVVVTFTAPPGLDDRITASSLDAVNVDNLDSAFLRAQALVTGALDAQLYAVPVNGDPVPEPVLGWSAAIAWYLLATDPRRPRLLEAYPEIEKRYIDVWGGVDSDLKRVAKGTFSLRGILSMIDPVVTPGAGGLGFYSNVPVYTADTFRGVQ
jgi:hypothetical protein